MLSNKYMRTDIQFETFKNISKLSENTCLHKMVFQIRNKVALITGGASGIGLSLAKEILCNDAKGIAIADSNLELGLEVQEELRKAFGPNKCIFIKTDVSSYNEFEAAFKKTVEHFGNIDILFNNAGIASGKFWQKEISINLNGTIHGMILGYDKFLPAFKQDEEALIVNTSSICGLEAVSSVPFYSATKSGIISLVKSYGIPDFYAETNVRVVGICPGVTRTSLFANVSFDGYGPRYLRFAERMLENIVTQESDFVAKETMEVVKYAANGTIWVIEDSEPAYEYIMPDRKSMKNNVLRKVRSSFVNECEMQVVPKCREKPVKHCANEKTKTIEDWINKLESPTAK